MSAVKPMPSEVYFTSAETKNRSLLNKLSKLVLATPIHNIVEAKDNVAVKVHMGTQGCTRFIRHLFVREIINAVKELEATPFVADTTTLYPGTRSTPAAYYETACLHGFAERVLGCPVVIADDKHFSPERLATMEGGIEEVEVAGAIAQADSLVVASHVKGHDLAGFGGAIKNIGMGCLTKAGKSQVHSATKPVLISDKCTGCGVCVKICPWNAITIHEEKAFIDSEKCKGCTSCIYSCSPLALYIPLEKKIQFQKLLASAASAIVKRFRGKILYVNFLMDVTPVCDCAPFSGLPIIPDMGVLASTDIVAIDKVSLDLVNSADIYPGSILDDKDVESSMSKFQVLHGVDPSIQVYEAEKLNLGSAQSILINIDGEH